MAGAEVGPSDGACAKAEAGRWDGEADSWDGVETFGGV